MAEKIPNGTAITSDNAVMITVLASAGISDAFSEEYSMEKSDG